MKKIKFFNNDVIYNVQGKERDELAAMLRQLIAQQSAFFGLIEFIGKRENVDFSQSQFDQNRLAFIKLPAVDKQAKTD